MSAIVSKESIIQLRTTHSRRKTIIKYNLYLNIKFGEMKLKLIWFMIDNKTAVMLKKSVATIHMVCL
jgi:hypothetical protein